MPYTNLRAFLDDLESGDQLHHIHVPVSANLEITEISRRALAKEGPALLFHSVDKQSIPVLSNLFCSKARIARSIGLESERDLRAFGQVLAELRQPRPPEGIQDILNRLPVLRKAANMMPKKVRKAPWQANSLIQEDVCLSSLPIQTCWPGDAAPLITWGLVITQGPNQKRHNMGIYRMQLLDDGRLIMRWLKHRGGAQDHRQAKLAKQEKFPCAVVIGADPATILAAVTPIPDTLSEMQFAGLLRNKQTRVVQGEYSGLPIPESAEIVLEGHISLDEYVEEGPFGDHTGYYNEVETFPVFTVDAMHMRDNAIYHSTYTGKPPDEPAILGEALNEIVIPLLQQQYPEIVDFFLPMEGCSYRVAVVSIRKSFAGHAKRVMFGIWGFLRQFMYTKTIIVVDDDIDCRNWKEVIWAISTRCDAARDFSIIENTPIDYLDFASPESGLGSKLGIDATNKWKGESSREWGKPITMTQEITRRVDNIWGELGLS